MNSYIIVTYFSFQVPGLLLRASYTVHLQINVKKKRDSKSNKFDRYSKV